MKKAITTWGWSAGVLAHSLLSLAVLAAFLGLWGLAAYEWLWIPESSVLLLALTLIWAAAQVLLAAAALAATGAGANEVAAAGARALPVVLLFRLCWKRLAETLVWLIAASALGLVLAAVFSWVNEHSLETASFLTLHLGKPVSYMAIQKCYVIIETLLWTAAVGALLGLLIRLLGDQPRGPLGKVLRSGCFGTSFLSSLLTVLVFGGLAYLLINWHPSLPTGFWDYSQLVLRVVVALILLAAGWLFWLLCLARDNSELTIQDSKFKIQDE
jgi:hypothetical protein